MAMASSSAAVYGMVGGRGGAVGAGCWLKAAKIQTDERKHVFFILFTGVKIILQRYANNRFADGPSRPGARVAYSNASAEKGIRENFRSGSRVGQDSERGEALAFNRDHTRVSLAMPRVLCL